jgi:sn1-specific diacylglycerol lipase
MPHLQYNKRKWRISSDELSVPGVFAIIGRILWSTLLIIILAYSTQRFARCSNGEGIITYLYLSLLVFVLSLLCEICLVKKSLVGSMVEIERREAGIGKYLTAHIVLGGFQFILALFGMFVIAAHSYVPCANELGQSPSFELVLLSVVVITQLVDITSLMCCCYTFSASESMADESSGDNLMVTRIKKVIKYTQFFSCNKFGGGQIEDDLNAVATALTTLFHHEGFLDVVPSDVVAGIILVGIQQKARKSLFADSSGNSVSLKTMSLSFLSPPLERPLLPQLSAQEKVISTKDINFEESREDIRDVERPSSQTPFSVSSRIELDKTSETDRAIMKAGADYVVYTMAIYTHFFAIFMQPVTGLCCLCFTKIKTSGCCNSCRSRSNIEPSRPCPVKGDNCGGFNHTGLHHLTKNTQSEVIYASYHNDLAAKPFAIFLNHEQKSVVITIRGSLSVEDFITDVNSNPVEMTAAGELPTFLNHKIQ